ncbi:MAG: hypothetical protein HY394_01295 [Candidatus Diapherotrites archaeon]|nr:hypothetical protein [Candidatus Diapherotrites archaeon]
MELFRATDPLGRKISLTAERYSHMTMFRPELEGKFKEIEETVCNPDFIKKSRLDGKVELYHKKVKNGRLLIIVIKTHENSGFVLAGYYSKTEKPGETSWKK